MKRFEYIEARSLEEVISLLGEHGDQASLLAGGTDLLVEMREDLRAPKVVINFKPIPGLDDLAYSKLEGLRIGAGVTARRLEINTDVERHYAGLWQAVRELGSIQVRNRATILGNICRASPSADTLPPLIADQARICLFGPAGERELPLEAFFTGPGKTVLGTDEVATGLLVPPPFLGTGKAYIKHGRRKAMELATVGVAVSVTIKNKRCEHVRIALGAVAPTPIRAKQAEAVLRDRPVDDDAIERAATAAQEEAVPISDVRASESYRQRMVKVLTARAIRQALENAK
jgi:carbon-monoxide dehydrogenase medium subunit